MASWVRCVAKNHGQYNDRPNETVRVKRTGIGRLRNRLPINHTIRHLRYMACHLKFHKIFHHTWQATMLRHIHTTPCRVLLDFLPACLRTSHTWLDHLPCTNSNIVPDHLVVRQSEKRMLCTPPTFLQLIGRQQQIPPWQRWVQPRSSCRRRLFHILVTSLSILLVTMALMRFFAAWEVLGRY